MRTRQLLTLVTIPLVFVNAVAQDEKALNFDDFIGVWNMVYENGRTPSLAISRDDDGTPKILVTSEFGTNGVRDIVVAGNEINFNQQSNAGVPGGQTFQINYKARLEDGKLVGTVDVIGLPLPMSDRFTATEAE